MAKCPSHTLQNEILDGSWCKSIFTSVNKHQLQCLLLRKATLDISHLDFSYNSGKLTCDLPLPLQALLRCREFPLMERHSKISSFEEKSDWAWQCLVFTSGKKQHIASSYTHVRVDIAQMPQNKYLEASLLLNNFNSVKGHKPQFVFAPGWNPCLFPS